MFVYQSKSRSATKASELPARAAALLQRPLPRPHSDLDFGPTQQCEQIRSCSTSWAGRDAMSSVLRLRAAGAAATRADEWASSGWAER
ncbi:hypothetical protein MGN70_004515 [Eutypa lata]|nr:hypothetical protein MGN70_004515 [Eutypa lata]